MIPSVEASDPQPCLEARDASVSQGGCEILRRVSARIPPGRVVAVLGANGAGKSTLLRVLAGELSPSSGRVDLEGRDLTSWSRLELARRRAVMRARPLPNFPLTVEGLVALGRHPHRRSPNFDARCIRETMAATEVEGLAGRRVSSLSTGELQRVQLARALTQIWGRPGADPKPPRWLLLDEPTANLDLQHAIAMLELVRRICAQGVGIAMVVHDLNLALRFADELVLLLDGAVLTTGPPSVLFDRPQLLVEAFGLDAELIHHPRGGWPVVLPCGRALPSNDERIHP